jgi:hypothetical protein
MGNLERIPVRVMSSMLQSVQGIKQLRDILISVFVGVFAIVFLFFLLVMLNIALSRVILWSLALGNKLRLAIFFKAAALTLVLSFIFFIPIIAGIFPIMKVALEFAKTQAMNFTPVNFIPFAIVSLIIMYFFALAYFFLVKEGSFRKSLRYCFKHGFGNIGKLFLIFLLFFILILALILGSIYLSKTNIFFANFLFPWGAIIILIIIKLFSFANRVYISKIEF